MLALLVSLAISLVLKRNFSQVEQRLVKLNVERALEAVSSMLGQLDDTARLFTDSGIARDANVLLDPAFQRAGMNFVAVYDRAGEVRLARWIDPASGAELKVPAIPSPFALVESAPGLLSLGGSKFLIAARPLDGGVLVIGQSLDSAAVHDLAECSHLSITIHNFDSKSLPPEFSAARTRIAGGDLVPAIVTGENTIAGFSVLRDQDRKPAVLLGVSIPRDIAQTEQMTTRCVIFALCVAGFAFAAVTLHLLQKHILSRLLALSDRIVRIGESHDPTGRLEVLGNDEISELAKAVNEMLGALEESRRSLREGEERHRAVVEQMSEGILLIDVTTRCVLEANAAAERLLGFTGAELRDFSLRKLLPPADGAAMDERIEQLLFDKGHFTSEQPYLHRDGSQIHMHAVVTVIALGRRQVLCVLLHDVSEQRRAQEELQRAHEQLEHRVEQRTVELSRANSLLTHSLKEKDVLLKEIHHRVKNNLQVISSLLNLQANLIEDPDALLIFLESRNRVRSMALVHEKLYQSGDLARIDFADYIRSLTGGLLSSFAGRSSSVRVAVEIEDVMLGVDTAVPCGLIVNELVSNCFKYAFPAGARGEISVAMHRDGSVFRKRLIFAIRSRSACSSSPRSPSSSTAPSSSSISRAHGSKLAFPRPRESEQDPHSGRRG